MAQWLRNRTQDHPQTFYQETEETLPAVPERKTEETIPAVAVQEAEEKTPEVTNRNTQVEMALEAFQANLNNCMETVGEEVMKNYIPMLHLCDVVPLDKKILEQWDDIQFFRISEMVYQENEFSVHKLATVFNAMSGKPCTLALMVCSNGQHCDFYLGIRSRDRAFSPGTMRKLLEQSLSGMFPGSKTEQYFNDNMKRDLEQLKIGSVSSVTCIADYKQNKDTVENKVYIQGLEKLIESMRGKPFTMICLANNLGHQDLSKTRLEYEQIYTALSPFANMQYSYGSNESASKSVSKTDGQTTTDSTGVTAGISTNQNVSDAKTAGSSVSVNRSNTMGDSVAVSKGTSHTVGTSDTVSESTTTSVSIADQSPGMLDMAVIRNTNTKIILRLPEQSDRELVGRAAGLNDEQVQALSRLEKGVAAVYQNDWLEAVLCKVEYYRYEEVQAARPVPIKDFTGVVKKTLMDALINNTLWDKLEWANKAIIKTDLSAGLKCSVLECSNKKRGSFSAMSKVAYALLDGEAAMAKMPQNPENAGAYMQAVLRPTVGYLQDMEWKRLCYMLLSERLVRHPEETDYLKKAMEEV